MSLASFGFTSSKRKSDDESTSQESKKAKPVSISPQPAVSRSVDSLQVDEAKGGKNEDKKDDEVDIVEQFLSYLESEEWKEKLKPATKTHSFKRLVKFVDGERSRKTVYPPPSEMFSAFNLTPFDSVKVVIIGQDPYHGEGQGHGLSFSVKKGVQIPPSLRNIYKEALNTNCLTSKPTHGNLSSWSSQGVFLLNVTLTVRKGEPNSHETKKKQKGEGWLPFTSAAIKALSRSHDGLVFFGWGRNAADLIDECVDKSKGHLVIKSSHPSPLGATKTSSPFIGSDCFNKANEYLKGKGRKEINWNSVNEE